MPPDFKALWITGEISGRLEETLEKLYEDRMKSGITSLTRIYILRLDIDNSKTDGKLDQL